MNKDVVFKNDNVTVFKDGRWRCEKCHRAARERGIKPPGIMNSGEKCRFIDEYGKECNNHYSNEEDLEQIKQLAQRRRREEEANAHPPPEYPIDNTEAVQAGCSIIGGIFSCISGMNVGGQGGTRGRKLRGRKTRGRKTRGRKTRGRKRKKTKNTRYQKRAR